MKLPTIRADLAQHMLYGGWVAALGACVPVLTMPDAPRGLLLAGMAIDALLMALLVGIGTEAVQAYRNTKAAAGGQHEVSWQDVLATLAGALPVALPLLALCAAWPA